MRELLFTFDLPTTARTDLPATLRFALETVANGLFLADLADCRFDCAASAENGPANTPSAAIKVMTKPERKLIKVFPNATLV